MPNQKFGTAQILFSADRSPDGKIRYGEKVELSELQRLWDKTESVMVGELKWVVRKPEKSEKFGNKAVYSVRPDSDRILWTHFITTGEEVYDSIFFDDLIGRQVIRFMIAMGIIILLFLYLIVVRPLSRVKRSVRGYQENKNSAETVRELSQIRSRNEIGVLADEFSALTEEMDRYTAKVALLADKQARAAAELGVAARIQTDMLPNDSFSCKGVEVFAAMHPAREVGGDFYDIYMIDEDHLALTIADVSGKGIPAALFMAVSKTILRDRTEMGGTPAQILADVNNRICEGNASNMFVTVWLGILTLLDGELICANGGHENPVMRPGNGPFELIRTRHGTALGVMENRVYTDERYVLSPGGAVFVYTDGVLEATRKDESMFAEKRLMQVMSGVPSDHTPRQILTDIKAAVDDFVGDAPQFDDLTMLCAVYSGEDNDASKDEEIPLPDKTF